MLYLQTVVKVDLSVVDILRRLNIDCDMVGLDKKKLMVIIISYLPVMSCG